MKNLISLVMILALAITTTLAPAVSHAMPHDNAKAAQTVKAEAPVDHDCHGHGKTETKADSQPDTPKDKHASNDCCEKGVCKCAGGTCHNLSKYFGSNTSSIAATSSDSLVFAFDNQFVDSVLSNRLKRPPRA
jgi:hypothetical protein